MNDTMFYTEQMETIKGTTVLGGRNKVNNPTFAHNTNYWTVATGSSTVALTNSGLSLVGSGLNLYQSMNTSDVESGSTYVARAHVDTVSGTIQMVMGTSANASSLGSKTLVSGWNSFQFTASTANVLTITSTTQAATDTLVLTTVEVREAQDLEITGNLSAKGQQKISTDWAFVQSGSSLIMYYQGAATTNVFSPDEA